MPSHQESETATLYSVVQAVQPMQQPWLHSQMDFLHRQVVWACGNRWSQQHTAADRRAYLTMLCPVSNVACRTALRRRAPLLGPGRVVTCGASRSSSTVTLPIFPLNVVALPCATVPLMIFEARYRVLFNTLLSGTEGIEQGLVQADAPWLGSKRFGMCFINKDGKVAQVGTVLEVKEFVNVPDGRLFVTNKGRERFRIVEVEQRKPLMVCKVELMQEEEESDEAAVLAAEVADLLRSTIKLNIKMQNITVTDDQLEPEELADLGPRDLSYWVASFFSDIKLLQQNLLEEDSIVERLLKEKKVLSETVNYFSAAAAIKGAFSSSAQSPRAGVDVGESSSVKERKDDE